MSFVSLESPCWLWYLCWNLPAIASSNNVDKDCYTHRRLQPFRLCDRKCFRRNAFLYRLCVFPGAPIRRGQRGRTLLSLVIAYGGTRGIDSGGARVSTQGGIKIFLGRHSGVNFLTTFFLLLPPIFSSSTTRGGRRTRRPRGAIPSGKGARGARCPPAPWLRHWMSLLRHT
jgi:hypothetical protein